MVKESARIVGQAVLHNKRLLLWLKRWRRSNRVERVRRSSYNMLQPYFNPWCVQKTFVQNFGSKWQEEARVHAEKAQQQAINTRVRYFSRRLYMFNDGFKFLTELRPTLRTVSTVPAPLCTLHCKFSLYLKPLRHDPNGIATH